GRFRLDSEIPISAHAARQAPSKLGLRPGETIAVEDAIKEMVGMYRQGVLKENDRWYNLKWMQKEVVK
ncbi:MAG TPA: hypothetical protein PK264_08605, partial [Hyphomicrobiaceae bacterium]|nr:hypothetical protein [Hyphomicrobiaceae bacterium]